MHAGRIAALGSVAELKQVFRGRAVVEVRTASPMAALRALDDLPTVEKTSPFGTALHVWLKPGVRDTEPLRRRLQDLGLAAESFEFVQPSLRRRVHGRRGARGGGRCMRKALAVGRKEFWQIVRDRRTLMILLFVPAFFLMLYGYALNWDIRHVRLAVADREHTAESRELLSSFANSTYFDIVASPASMEEIERLMDRGRIRVALVIPEGMTRDLRSGRHRDRAGRHQRRQREHGHRHLRVRPGHRARRVGVAAAATGRLAGGGAAHLGAAAHLVQPELQSTLFLVPGLIAFIVMISSVVSTSLSIVREKERGTWEQVRMSPISTPAYVVGKTIPYFFISLISALLIIAASMLLFDCRCGDRGSCCSPPFPCSSSAPSARGCWCRPWSTPRPWRSSSGS